MMLLVAVTFDMRLSSSTAHPWIILAARKEKVGYHSNNCSHTRGTASHLYTRHFCKLFILDLNTDTNKTHLTCQITTREKWARPQDLNNNVMAPKVNTNLSYIAEEIKYPTI